MARKNRPTSCRSCGYTPEDKREISWAGLCLDCQIRRMHANLVQLVQQRGPYYERWRSRLHVATAATDE